MQRGQTLLKDVSENVVQFFAFVTRTLVHFQKLECRTRFYHNLESTAEMSFFQIPNSS